MTILSRARILRSLTTKLFEDWGRRVDVIRLEQGSYNVATGETAIPVRTKYPGWGRLGTYNDRLSEGTLVNRNERLLTFVPDDDNFVPKVNDWVEVDEGRFTVVAPAVRREVAGELICFSLPVRNSI